MEFTDRYVGKSILFHNQKERVPPKNGDMRQANAMTACRTWRILKVLRRLEAPGETG